MKINKKIYFRMQSLSVRLLSNSGHHQIKKGAPGRFFKSAEKKSVAGSVTVEGAIVISICFLVFAATLSFFNLLGGQIKEYNEAFATSQKEAVVACLLGDSSPDDITTFYEYSDKVLLLPENIRNYIFSGEIVRKSWTGRSLNDVTGDEDTDEYVYVAENGSVYHTTESCTHLKLTISEVSFSEIDLLRNQYGEKYTACELCGDKASDTVYVGAEGDRYHSTRECSGLKRTYKKVKKSECDLPACSRCGKE